MARMMFPKTRFRAAMVGILRFSREAGSLATMVRL